MSTTLRRENQKFDGSLAIVSDPMDVVALFRSWAPRIARSADGIGAKDRQFLYDIARGRRDLSILARVDELAACCALEDALFFPMEWRGDFVRRLRPCLPDWQIASREEEEANHRGNLAQQEWHERRSSSTAQVLRGAMNYQALQSMTLHDAVALEERRFITVVSR